MKLKDKIKTYNFWISLISAVLIIVRIIGEHFGWFINEGLIMDILTGVCGIFVLLGILSSPAKKDESMEETIKNLTEQSKQIQKEQQELTQTIKADISQKQLSIQEQIALLKQNALAKQSAEQEKSEYTEVVEQTNQPEQDQPGIVYVPEVEVVAPAVRAEVETAKTCVETPFVNNTEEITLGGTEPLSAQTLVDEVLPEVNSIEVVEVDSTQEETVFVVEAQVEDYNVQNQTTTDTINVEDTVNQEAESITKAEEVAQDNEIIDYSALSNEQLKELLFEILQRL